MFRNKLGYTLAEILITLGIIGVVAAMTIPNLITGYQKHVTETRLLKFYSTMNQAFRLSQSDNGDMLGWVTADKNYNDNEIKEWLNEYLLPYIQYYKVETCVNSGGFKSTCVKLNNGTIFTFKIDANGADIGFYCDGNFKNESKRNAFLFQLSKKKSFGK